VSSTRQSKNVMRGTRPLCSQALKVGKSKTSSWDQRILAIGGERGVHAKEGALGSGNPLMDDTPKRGGGALEGGWRGGEKNLGLSRSRALAPIIFAVTQKNLRRQRRSERRKRKIQKRSGIRARAELLSPKKKEAVTH